jgi:hypothetical protein
MMRASLSSLRWEWRKSRSTTVQRSPGVRGHSSPTDEISGAGLMYSHAALEPALARRP